MPHALPLVPSHPPNSRPTPPLSPQDLAKLQEECRFFQLEAHQDGDADADAMFMADVVTSHEIINTRIDRISAHILQHSDEFANERNEIQLGTRQGTFQWSLWINTSKNPRLKAVELPQLSMTVEIPKQIALANIAMRVQLRVQDEYFERCSCEYMAVGGVLYVDLLALPPPAKKVKGWTLRQVTPLSYNVQRIPYPIPPAGADPATYKSEEEPPPLGFTYPFTPNIRLLDYPRLAVGWWDPSVSGWSTAGVTDVDFDKMGGNVTFKSTHIGPLAVVQSRARLMPYSKWSVRPTGGRNGSTAAVTLSVGLPEQIVFEVGPSTVALTSPAYPELADLMDKPMRPLQLLQRLSEHGLHLLPADRDAGYAGVVVKDRATEKAACYDVALLAGVFLIGSSRWNQTAEPDEAICRISEVLDWEEGGRTELSQLERIFEKEKEDGERRVLAVIRRGTKVGVGGRGVLVAKTGIPSFKNMGSLSGNGGGKGRWVGRALEQRAGRAGGGRVQARCMWLIWATCSDVCPLTSPSPRPTPVLRRAAHTPTRWTSGPSTPSCPGTRASRRCRRAAPPCTARCTTA